MENVNGGTLCDLIKQRNLTNTPLTEDECAKAIKGILLGLRHLHQFDFIHRDLKPSNVVVEDLNDLETVKLVDFGLAIKYQAMQGLDENCGTLVY